MQSNKIDNQIREKLNAREIEASAKSWDRLDAMLSVKEEKKPKKGFLWLYIAASFLVFFGLGFFLLNSEETLPMNQQVPVIVDVEKIIDSTQTNKVDNILIETQQSILVQNETKLVKKQHSIKTETIKHASLIPDQISSIEQNLANNQQLITSNAYKYISPERLLAEVQNESKSSPFESKISAKKTIKVDANALLSKVEKELDESYRETTLDKLNRNYNSIKSAVANRNYE